MAVVGGWSWTERFPEPAHRHFGVTITPIILSFIESTSALACSGVVPVSNSNPTETDLMPDTVL